MTEEVNFYSDEKGVRITNSRAIFGAKTYAMANISSISMGTIAAKLMPGILVAIMGLLIIIPSASLGKVGFIIFGVLVLVIGILMSTTAKATYIVKIASTSGEADAISSHDKNYIQSVVNAMNEAIIKRG